MTTVMNSKLVKAFIKGLQQKLMKIVQPITKKLTNQDLIEMIFQTLPNRPQDSLTINQARIIIAKNQSDILDQQEQVNYLRKKEQIENQLTASFIKAIMKDRNQNKQQNQIITAFKRDNVMFGPQFSRISGSRLEISKTSENLYEKSPISGIQLKQDLEQSVRRDKYRICATSRSRVSTYQSSQFTIQGQNEERQKVKALSKLRKLQKYVFEKQNIKKDRSQNRLWNCGVSPSKKRYQQENDNLKAIQTNLVTHLSMQLNTQFRLQKYREIPSIEGLAAKQEALKKKERSLKELNENLEKREFEINRKHSEFLKRQKSFKVL